MATKIAKPYVEVLSAPPLLEEPKITIEVTATRQQFQDFILGEDDEIDIAIEKALKKYLPKPNKDSDLW